MSYSDDYTAFYAKAIELPIDDTLRRVFADNCDENTDVAGGSTRSDSPYGQSARGALTRLQGELVSHPRDEAMIAEQKQLIAQARPLLLNEISQVEGWQTIIAPRSRGNIEAITNDQLAKIFQRGMIGYAEFSDYAAGQFENAVKRIPLTSLTLRGRPISNNAMNLAHWLTAERVREIPNTISTLATINVLRDRAAQDALFKHPAMADMQHLHLTTPDSGTQEHVNVDLGLSDIRHSNNPNFDITTHSLDQGLVERLTSGTLSKQLKTLTLEYNDVQNSGVRALLGSEKLHGTVIELAPSNMRRPEQINTWAQQIEPRLWLDLAQHNRRAFKAQGGIYELPEHVKLVLNNNRSTIKWLMRRVIKTAEDLPTLSI